MNCPLCRSDNIDSSGFCLTCGCEISLLSNEQEQILEAAHSKEEINDQNLQDIIDVAVSYQAAPSPSPEYGGATFIPAADDLIFREIDKNESAVDQFVVTTSDTPNVSDMLDAAYAANTKDAKETVDDADAEYTAEYEDLTDIENYEDIEDVSVAVGSSYNANDNNPEGRLIFLSRTLSGLIDLFLIALFSGIFLFLADYFTNAPILSSIRVISFAALFLIIYLLYSIFFLGTSRQTIGMMATDLRVVGMNQEWVSMSQVVRRSAVFPVSLFGLGIGLLAGVFSRKCLCLHDRLSKTCVVRTL